MQPEFLDDLHALRSTVQAERDVHQENLTIVEKELAVAQATHETETLAIAAFDHFLEDLDALLTKYDSFAAPPGSKVVDVPPDPTLPPPSPA